MCAEVRWRKNLLNLTARNAFAAVETVQHGAGHARDI